MRLKKHPKRKKKEGHEKNGVGQKRIRKDESEEDQEMIEVTKKVGVGERVKGS